MSISSKVIPENVLRLMKPEDRPAGAAGRTVEQTLARGVAVAEKQVQRDIENYCLQRGWPHYRQRTDRRTTGRVGQPDHLICVQGRFVALEVKIGHNEPTRAQEAEIQAIIANGGVAGVVRSLAEAISLLRRVEAGEI